MLNIDFEEIGNRIHKIRINNNLTQNELATLLNVTKSSISQWESGKGISIDNLYSLAKLFCITVDDLVKDECRNNFRIQINVIDKLSKIDVDHVLEAKDYKQLKYYCNNMYAIKKRAIHLLKNWALDSLSHEDINEFKLINKFFSLPDELYFDSLFKSDNDEDKFILNVKNLVKIKLNNLTYKTNSELEYELSKFFVVKNDFDVVDIIENKKDLKILQTVLSEMFQHEKDDLFIKYILKYYSLNEYEDHSFSVFHEENDNFILSTSFIEDRLMSLKDDEIAKIFINENSNVLFPENFMDLDFIYNLPCDFFPDKYKKIEYEEYNYDYVKGWRYNEYEEYKKIINYKYTSFLKTLINNKENNPLQYYKDLLEIFKL